MHLDDAIPHAFVLTTLYSSEQLDRDPLLLALQQCRHDLSNAIFVKRLRPDVIDIFFVVLADLLFPWLFGHGCVPGIAILDAKSFDRDVGEFGCTLGLSLAAEKACTIRLAAVTRLWVCTVPVDVVVED